VKLKYFLLILCSATVLSLFFVRKKKELIKLAYKENQNSRLYKELLDSNRYLRYNLISLKSSPYLADRLLNEASGYELPKQSQVLNLILPQENNPAVLKEAKANWAFKLQESWPIVLVKSYDCLGSSYPDASLSSLSAR